MEKAIDLAEAIEQPCPVTAQRLMESSEDASLLKAARDGDRAAFGRLYDRYARVVHGIMLSRVPPGEVDDLVQDVSLVALKQEGPPIAR